MFGYRHIYHAGNFADVVKHTILCLLVRAMQRKETPCCIIDTHGGLGRYDLQTEQAQKTSEFQQGVARVLASPHIPAALDDYLGIVRSLNANDGLRHYPGSPWIARQLLRPQDRLLLSELNPADHALLKQLFADDRQVAVHLRDAYQGLRASLPPKEKRALILIDPAYELKDEYQRLVQGLQAALARFPNGVYAVWYPIMSRSLANRFYQDLAATGIRRMLRTEMLVREDSERKQMNGSGMIIINPPWQVDEQLRTVLAWLANTLGQGPGAGACVDWLVPE